MSQTAEFTEYLVASEDSGALMRQMGTYIKGLQDRAAVAGQLVKVCVQVSTVPLSALPASPPPAPAPAPAPTPVAVPAGPKCKACGGPPGIHLPYATGFAAVRHQYAPDE